MSNYLADTTLLIDHLRGNEATASFLEKHTPYISTVSVAELIQGSRDKRELATALALCDSLPKAEINRKIAKKSIALLSTFHISHGLLFLDAIIAATAIENNLMLITGNIKAFHFLKELDLLSQREVLH